MKTFEKRILALKDEVHDLKTVGLLSSSSLGVAEHIVSITLQIVGYSVNYQNDNCASSHSAVFEIIPADGKTMLTSIALHSSMIPLIGRRETMIPRITNGHNGYEFRIIDGSAADLTTIQGGGTVAPITFDFLITGTSEFTTNVTYRQYH